MSRFLHVFLNLLPFFCLRCRVDDFQNFSFFCNPAFLPCNFFHLLPYYLLFSFTPNLTFLCDYYFFETFFVSLTSFFNSHFAFIISVANFASSFPLSRIFLYFNILFVHFNLLYFALICSVFCILNFILTLFFMLLLNFHSLLLGFPYFLTPSLKIRWSGRCL